MPLSNRGFWSTVGAVLMMAVAGLVLLTVMALAAAMTDDPWGNFWKMAGIGVVIVVAGQIGSRIDDQINSRHQAVLDRLDEIAHLLRNR